MATKVQSESAKILSFPAGGRRVVARPGTMMHSALEIEAMQFDMVECGSGWYHDAAIRDAANNPKR